MDIVRMSEDGLTKEVWTLYVNALSGGPGATVQLRVQGYVKAERPTKRHKNFVVKATTRKKTYHDGPGLTYLPEAPRLTDDEVRAEVSRRTTIDWKDSAR